jgi:hypothetical protein
MKYQDVSNDTNGQDAAAKWKMLSHCRNVGPVEVTCIPDNRPVFIHLQ